jgi:succinoglycan biosynthesis transport protein ExoP
MGDLAIGDGVGFAGDAWPSGTKRRASLNNRYLGAVEILRILRRRRWFIGCFVALVTLCTVIFLALTPPQYSATSTVLVLPTNRAGPPVDPAAAQSVTPTPNEESAIQTKVEVLESPALIKRTAKSLQLAKDPEFSPQSLRGSVVGRLLKTLTRSGPGDISATEQSTSLANLKEEALTTNLTDHLSIDRVARSNVIAITASSVDPAKATRIANRLVDTYVDNQQSDAKSDRAKLVTDLTQQVSKARDNSLRLDAAAAAYRKAHGLLTSEPGGQAASEVGQLSGLLAQARSESAQQGRLASPAHTGSGDISATSALLTDLQQQEATLMRKQSELASFYGSGYPAAQQTAAELAAIRGRIAEERDRVTADLRVAASASQARTSALNGDVSRVKSTSLAHGEAAVKLLSIEREAAGASALYSSLLGQLNLAISSSVNNPGDIARLSRATIPLSPSFPLAKRVIAVAVIAALALGMLLALMLELADTRLRTADQAYQLLGLPTLAMVPEVRTEGGEVHDIVAQSPRSRFAESMRNLLIEIETRLPGRRSRVIVLTSPLENEGKSTIANSLAAAAASVGRQVVCVDFDLRRPTLAAPGDIVLSTPNQAAGPAGLVAYLSDRVPGDELALSSQPTPFPSIDAGEIPSDPGGLIASHRLPALIEHLRQRFALVIVNAPPILLVRDAKTLAEHADATLLVLHWGKSKPEVAIAATEMFGRSFDGVVLNRVDYKAHSNRRYGDALQHVAASNGYYDSGREVSGWLRHGSGWPGRVLGLFGRRAAG